MRKVTVVILNQLNIKKIKSTRTILKKKIIRKNHMRKYCSNPQCFKEKNYKARFLISSILKKKSTKIFLKKIIKKQKNIIKKHVGKHCSNSQYFVRKATVVILNQLNIKKIKSTKIILKKIIKIKSCWETL
jgi:hypothetical protein